MTGQTPFSAQLSAKLSCGLLIALLALSLTFGTSAVRAEPDSPTPSWREMLLDPIMTAVHTVEARLSSLEASFKSQQIATEKLCVYDNTGETCITKAQLDAVLASMARAAAAAPGNAPPAAITEAPAIVSEPSVTVTEAPAVVTEAPAAVTEGKATVIEPSVAVIEAPAVVTEAPAIITEAKAQDRFQQAPAETTSIVTPPASAATPESVLEENAMEQKPAHTGPAIAASSGDALVRHPEVDISIPAPASGE